MSKRLIKIINDHEYYLFVCTNFSDYYVSH